MKSTQLEVAWDFTADWSRRSKFPSLSLRTITMSTSACQQVQSLNQLMSELVFQWIDSFILKSSAPLPDATQITMQSISSSPREKYEFTDSDVLLVSRTYPTIIRQTIFGNLAISIYASVALNHLG